MAGRELGGTSSRQLTGVGKSWIGDDLVPALDRQLTGNENRTSIVAVLDDLEQIAALFGIELLWSPVVENEEIDARKSAQELRVSSVAAGECESHKQSRHAVIKDGEVLAAGLVTERAGEPAFADAAQAHDIVPKNSGSKLSSTIRIIHALANVLLRSGESSMAVCFTL